MNGAGGEDVGGGGVGASGKWGKGRDAGGWTGRGSGESALQLEHPREVIHGYVH